MNTFAQPLATLGVAVVGLIGTLLLQWRQRKRLHTDPNSVRQDLEIAELLPEGALKSWTVEYSSLRLRALFESETRRRSLDDHPISIPAIAIAYLAFLLTYAVSVFAIWANLEWSGKLVYALTLVAYFIFPFMLRHSIRAWLNGVAATGLRQPDRETYQSELQVLRENLVAMRTSQTDPLDSTNAKSTEGAD